jgi:hypothetical protein
VPPTVDIFAGGVADGLAEVDAEDEAEAEGEAEAEDDGVGLGAAKAGAVVSAKDVRAAEVISRDRLPVFLGAGTVGNVHAAGR